MSDATVIVRFDHDGELTYHVFGDARLYIVDERCPGDRVYEWLERATADDIADLIPVGEVIGNRNDERHPVAAHRIRAALDGKRHLSVVDPDL
tara:strand:- start:29799 stop:30077 length:279 start_codon:yes stop_codon:yes gene_type:complete